MKLSWSDRWKAFMMTKRHYPDTGTHTTADGTATIRGTSLAPKQSASSLPRNLKRLREAKGLSPTQLASKAGVSASTVRAMETANYYDTPETERVGKKPTYGPNPTLMSLLAVAEALGVGIGDLVEEREP